MRRADRLFQIIQLLRTRRVTTARWLAEQLEVSERTIYRDIQDLICSGVPIEGEAGIGYVLRRGFDLPPLMFTKDEIIALTLGARIVKSWADPGLSRAADQALSKVELALPADLRARIDQTYLFSPVTQITPGEAETMAMLREAIERRNKVRMDYTRADGEASARTVWPLALLYWGRTWTVGAWCEWRASLRNFRLDRIDQLTVLSQTFTPVPGRTIEDLFREGRGEMQGNQDK